MQPAGQRPLAWKLLEGRTDTTRETQQLMTRLVAFAVVLLLSPKLVAAGPILPAIDFLWRFSGAVTSVSVSPSPDTDYGPLLDVGARVEGLVGVSLPAGSDAATPLSLSVDEIYAGGGFMTASLTGTSDFDPARPATAPTTFDFSGAANGFVLFQGPALLDIGGQADEDYLDIPFLQFRWGLEGGTIQQIANADGQSEPSHFFSYRWEVESLPLPVPEPAAGALLATALALLAAFLTARLRRGFWGRA